MQQQILPSTVYGTITACPSKSYMQRVLIASMLAKGNTQITNPCFAEDVKNLMRAMSKLGIEIISEDNYVYIKQKNTLLEKQKINIGESGLALRMLIPVLGALGVETEIDGYGSLKNRKLGFDINLIQEMGLEIKTLNKKIPLHLKGKIKGGKYFVDGSETSQFVSGLLFAMPLLKQDSQIVVHNLKSRPYIDLTINILNKFGINIKNNDYRDFYIKANQKYKPQDISIENDWSGAAFMLVAGAIAGEIKVEKLNILSKQADKMILQALKLADVFVNTTNNSVYVKTRNALKAFVFDASDCPDLFPPIVALALNCQGTTTISGVNRLFNKESNRAKTLIKEFGKLGAKITVENNNMLVQGTKINGGKADANNDHRIAMALSVAALKAKDTVFIDNAESVAKSYPGFYNDLGFISSANNGKTRKTSILK